MRILIFTDVHWSERSSITNRLGAKYTCRLEMLIKSMNWVNDLATREGCSAMICAGDMMDKSVCTDMELTALKDIRWNDLPCYFLCGNHESSEADLRFSTVKSLESARHFVISEPTVWKYDNGADEIRFLPYVTESDRKPLAEYFGKGLGKTILISHNDLAGVSYGPVVSKVGFGLKEIEGCCDLYLNGHIHNSEFITPKILNLGSLSAHNFTNDSAAYRYGCWILDTDTLGLEFFENPHAFNFYKIEIEHERDLAKLNGLKPNPVLSVKCREALAGGLKDALAALHPVEARVIVARDGTAGAEADVADLRVDHIAKFIELSKAKFGEDPIIASELGEICR